VTNKLWALNSPEQSKHKFEVSKKMNNCPYKISLYMDSRLPWAWALLACWGKKTLSRCNKWNVKKTTLTTSKTLKGRGESLKWCNQIRCGFQKDSSHLVQTKLCQWRCTLPGPKKTLRSWDCQTHQVTKKSLGLFNDGSR